jgi:hypothetical protein
MRRREFIGLLGGAGVLWPLAVRAQQPAMPVVALINGAMANTVTSSRNAAAFSKGLSEIGSVACRREVRRPYRSNSTVPASPDTAWYFRVKVGDVTRG